jgi:hypothetical protein
MFICSCKKTVLNVSEQDKGVFSLALKTEILRMIDVKKGNISYNDLICNVIFFQDFSREGKCIVMISLNKSIVIKNTIKFVPPNIDCPDTQIDDKIINGYTFVGTELIGCSIVSDSCSNNLININELYSIKDSIPGFPNVLYHDPDLIYDAPMRMYQIINADSLQLIKSLFVGNDRVTR